MKRILSLFLAIILCFSLSVTAFADPSVEVNNSEFSDDAPQEPGRPEETIWYFRVLNGIRQMRLWSITYRKWLTPWIDIGPVDP